MSSMLLVHKFGFPRKRDEREKFLEFLNSVSFQPIYCIFFAHNKHYVIIYKKIITHAKNASTAFQ